MTIPPTPMSPRPCDMAKGVSRASHKMKAFVRFRRVDRGGEDETYAAWFEPAHRVTEATAPFFARRFTNMDWSILTPDACVALGRAATGLHARRRSRRRALARTRWRSYWRTYYASIFNPARLNRRDAEGDAQALLAEPAGGGAHSGADRQSRGRPAAMVAARPYQPAAHAQGRCAPCARRLVRWSAPDELEEVAAGVEVCRRCDLWRDATQGVPGEGRPIGAADVRRRAARRPGGPGRPPVRRPGRPGARQGAGRGRRAARRTYVTNAVKHFKHELRGKRRHAQDAGPARSQACRWWLDAERRLVRPRVIVALGATAALGGVRQGDADRGMPRPGPAAARPGPGRGDLSTRPSCCDCRMRRPRPRPMPPSFRI
jgi:uracil-DNA glycosylase